MTTHDRITVGARPRALLLGSALALSMTTVHGAVADETCVPEWSANVGAGDFGMVVALATLDDGESITHYIANNGVARWTGDAWMQLGSEQLVAVRALAVFDDGDGPALHAAPEVAFLEGGTHSGVVRWDGHNWLAVGEGPGVFAAAISALTVFDDGDGPALYAGGFMVGGPVECISRWDGRSWTPLTGATGTLTAVNVRAIAEFDDGSGPALFVGGNQLAVNGEPTQIAKWDGTNWSAVPGMPQADNTVIIAMTVHDDGTGPALYVGGFSSPDSSQLPLVSRFDGTDWSIVATPLNGSIQALASFDDGSGDSGDGPALYVGGGFSVTITDSGSQPLARIARLHGNAWEQLGDGTTNGVFALQSSVDITDNVTPALHVGGSFGNASGVPSPNFAQWRGCPSGPSHGLADLNGDGVVDGADLGILLSSWGPCDGCPADLNDDGVVDGADLGILLSAWG